MKTLQKCRPWKHMCRWDDLKMDLKDYASFKVGYRVFSCERCGTGCSTVKGAVQGVQL